MIDHATGEIQFRADGIRVGHALTRELLLASSISSQCRELVRNEPYCSFALPTVQFGDQPFAWSVWFRASVLLRVSIQCASPAFGSSWSDWSENRELARKRVHDSLLQQSLGQDWCHKHFTWGRVESLYDSKGGFSSIVVTYEP
jgi:hypothetical protein